MKRTPLLAATAALGCGLLGPVGLAVADDGTAPATSASPQAVASPNSVTTTTTTTGATPGAAGSTSTTTSTTTTTTTTTTSTSPTPTPTAPPPVVYKVGVTSPTIVTLRRYRITGSTRPTSPRAVDVFVQRLSGRTWKTLHVDRRIDSRGRYSVPFRTGLPRAQKFRAVAHWKGGGRAVSRTMVRHVLPRTDTRISGPLRRSSVPWSYRAGCPVGPSGLRRISMNYFTYHHSVARGSLVVRASAVDDLVRVFKKSFTARFPIRSMRPSDAFYARGHRTPTGSDLAAMRADNTSAFNCRPVTGNPYRVSQHSYGNAIDINTVRNPYVVGSRVYPSFARTYLNRRDVRTGMITSGGILARTMRANGWPWGARWAHPDYQHFSSNGG